MTKRAIAGILILLLLLPAVIAAGSLFVVPESPFDKLDTQRSRALEAALGSRLTTDGSVSSVLSEHDRFIVRFNSDVPLEAIEEALEGVEYTPLAQSESRLFAISGDADFVQRHEDIIDHHERDLVRSVLAVTDDPIIIPAYDSTGIVTAWDSVTAKSDVIVAVLDTGVDRSHEDLAGANILAGYDAVAKTAGVNGDSVGHGTGVTGIIAATANNRIGIAGVAYGATVLPIKVSSSGTTIYSSDLIAGIRFAADAGAKVINMSVGGYAYSDAEQEAIDYALSKGCILIAASGNGGDTPYADKKSYPASYDGVISVASCNELGERSLFSQYNDSVDVAAPGESIPMPRVENGESVYVTDSGTSFSCAIVSGIAALAVSHADPSARFNCEEFLALITDSCGYSRNDELGHGIIDAREIIRRSNLPIVTGISNGATYFDRVHIGFNRGEGFLDGEPFEDGDAVISNGRHIFTVVDNGAEKTVSFRLDYDPLSYEFKEFASFAYFDFERGSALLDGFPYVSGDRITASGQHKFVLTDGEETVEKTFVLAYTLPEVHGVEDGKTYDRPVEIKILGNGIAELDGKEIFGEAVVAESGRHILTVKSGNGAVSQSYEFEIDFPYADFIENDYANGRAAIDEDNGYFCLYGDSLVGVRIYDIEKPEEYLHFLPVGRVYSHFFKDNMLYLLGDDGVTVIDRASALEGETAIVNSFSDEDMLCYTFAEDEVYCFDNSYMYRVDVERGITHHVTRLGFPCERAFYSNGVFCLLSPSNDRLIRLYDRESDTVAIFDSGISLEGVPLCHGDGYLAAGRRLIDLTARETVLEFVSFYAVKIENGILYTDSRMIEIASGREIASFPISLSDVCVTESGVYLFASDAMLIRVEGGIEGAAAYCAAERLTVNFSTIESVSDYRSNIYYDVYSTPISASANSQSLYVILSDRNAICGISHDGHGETDMIPLRFSPARVVAENGYVAVTFKNALSVYLAREDDVANGIYIPLPAACESVAIGNDRLFAVVGGSLFYCNADGSGRMMTTTAADAVASDNGRLYLLDGVELTAYDFSMTKTLSITTNGGDIHVGGGIAVGGVIYDLTLNSEFARVDEDILCFKGNTIVTESGVYSIESMQYAGSLYCKEPLCTTIGGNNELIVIGSELITLSVHPDGREISAIPIVDGITEGGIYNDSVVIEYSHGFGYLDGKPFESGDTVTSAGAHTFLIALPGGYSLIINFTVTENISAIEFLGGDRVMSIGETVTLRVLYLPEGAGSVPVSFRCDSEGLTVSESGEATANAVGVYTVHATAETDYGRFTAECSITVRDDLIAFTPESGIVTDRDNGFVLGLAPGTTAESVVAMLYNSENVFILTPKGSEAKKTEFVGTGYRIVIRSDDTVTDELTFVIIGDTDSDGCITAYDLYVQERILRGYGYERAYRLAADLNGDGIAADNDYRALKYNVLRITEAELGTPSENLFGLSTLQTVTRIESGNIIDVAVCISGCKYARGVSGVIDFGEGLEFVSGESTGWETDFKDLGGRLSFFAYGNDGESCGRAFKVLLNLKFRVTASAGETITLSSDGFTAAFPDGCRRIRFESANHFVYAPSTGDFNIEFFNAYSFDFDPEIHDYNAVIPYNNALADVLVTRNIGQTVTLSSLVIPDSDSSTITVTLQSPDGSTRLYTIRVRRDDEPRFDTNCRLDVLEVEGHRLEPHFSPDIFDYDISVPHGTEKINVYCVPQNSSAQVVIGDTTLHGESTAITVTVGSPDGEMLVYTINVTVLPPEEESSADVSAPDEGNGDVFFTVLAVFVGIVALVAVFLLYARLSASDSNDTNEGTASDSTEGVANDPADSTNENPTDSANGSTDNSNDSPPASPKE